MLDRMLVANRSDAGQQRPIEYREVLEQRNYDRTRPVAVTGRWQRPISCSWLQRLGRLDASDQDDSSVRSVAEKAGFRPQWLLSQWGL